MINRSAEFTKLVNESTEYLELLVRGISGKEDNYPLQVILLELLKRATLNISAINKLTESFISNNNFRFPIYILLRTLVADAIIGAFLIGSNKGGYERNVSDGKIAFDQGEEKRFDEQLRSLTLEALKKAEIRLNDLTEAKVMDSEKRKEIMDKWKNRFPDCFDSSGKVKNGKSGLKHLVKGNENEYAREFAFDIYSNYFHLSQYEHFSRLTKILDEASTMSSDIERMSRCLHFILRGIRSITICLNQPTHDIEKLMRDAMILSTRN